MSVHKKNLLKTFKWRKYYIQVLKNCDFEQFLKFQGSKITNQKKIFYSKIKCLKNIKKYEIPFAFSNGDNQM
jgi:hypothetical protein